ncbi:hypothetical protein [uncultured Massilia sp.]|uniref:hypothetical protein n=1 Tax=uncultured Massilia sp. TaxID=169973 RepID=UPI00258689DB|nr:hypothetical protein [uncultured Massilia sp.]
MNFASRLALAGLCLSLGGCASNVPFSDVGGLDDYPLGRQTMRNADEIDKNWGALAPLPGRPDWTFGTSYISISPLGYRSYSWVTPGLTMRVDYIDKNSFPQYVVFQLKEPGKFDAFVNVPVDGWERAGQLLHEGNNRYVYRDARGAVVFSDDVASLRINSVTNGTSHAFIREKEWGDGSKVFHYFQQNKDAARIAAREAPAWLKGLNAGLQEVAREMERNQQAARDRDEGYLSASQRLREDGFFERNAAGGAVASQSVSGSNESGDESDRAPTPEGVLQVYDTDPDRAKREARAKEIEAQAAREAAEGRARVSAMKARSKAEHEAAQKRARERWEKYGIMQ